MKNLTSLSLPFTGYQDEGLKNADMPLLSKLKSLKSLNLMGTEITDEGLKAIGDLKNLERLNLKSCWIEGHGLRHLAQLKNLKELDLGRITALGEELRTKDLNIWGRWPNWRNLACVIARGFPPRAWTG